MRIEIDQSGKVENTQTDSVLALSNNNKYSIIIPANLKRKWFSTLRKPKRTTYLYLFSASLFLLIKDHVDKNSQIYIDREYVGQERNVKAMLLRLLESAKKKITADQIYFTNIGKKSDAHKLALMVFREREKANKTIKESELMGLL